MKEYARKPAFFCVVLALAALSMAFLFALPAKCYAGTITVDKISGSYATLDAAVEKMEEGKSYTVRVNGEITGDSTITKNVGLKIVSASGGSQAIFRGRIVIETGKDFTVIGQGNTDATRLVFSNSLTVNNSGYGDKSETISL